MRFQYTKFGSKRATFYIEALILLGEYDSNIAAKIYREQIKAVRKRIDADNILYNILVQRREEIGLPPM